MHIPYEIVDQLEEYGTNSRESTAWRFVFGDRDPLKPSLRGGRWGTREGFAVLYTSLSKETALSEGEHLVGQYSIPPEVSWNIYNFEVALQDVVDLTRRSRLEELGVDLSKYAGEWGNCPFIGAAANFLGHEALIAPSARATGDNLIIFSDNLKDDSKIEVLTHQVLRKDQRGAS